MRSIICIHNGFEDRRSRVHNCHAANTGRRPRSDAATRATPNSPPRIASPPLRRTWCQSRQPTTTRWCTKLLRKSYSLRHLGPPHWAGKMKGDGAIEFGAHGRTRTAGLLLTKEVLEDDFPICAPLRSNAEAIANNRCLAALPRKCHIFASVNPVHAQFGFARLSVRPPVARRCCLRSRSPAPLCSKSHEPLSTFPWHALRSPRGTNPLLST